MKPTLLSALVASALLASGAAFACDDMKMTDDGDGGHVHGKRVAAADTGATAKPVPIDASTLKSKPAAKQKSQAKPLPQGSAALVKTGG